jgi:hypothetical protein
MYPDEDELMAKDAVVMAVLVPLMLVAFVLSIPTVLVGMIVWRWRDK